jgi:hypothetical protein
MSRRIQIVLRHPGALGGMTSWQRVKILSAGLLLLAVIVGLLWAALIVGSIMAAVLGILLVAAAAMSVVMGSIRSLSNRPPRRSDQHHDSQDAHAQPNRRLVFLRAALSPAEDAQEEVVEDRARPEEAASLDDPVGDRRI